MRHTVGSVLALWMVLAAACGRNAAPVTLEAAGTQTAVPVLTWRLESTPTPGAATPTAGALPQPLPTAAGRPAPAVPPPATPGGTARAQAITPPGTVPPTIGPIRAPLPTPTLDPPVQCQFGTGAVTVLPAVAGSDTGPGVVPTYYQGGPGLTTFATGEPLPGVFLELRLSKTSFVAGAVIQADTWVRNTSAQAVSVSPGILAALDGETEPGASVPADPRSFPYPFRGPVSPVVPGGQTWSIPSIVQLPFDAAEHVHLQARVGLAAIASSTQMLSGPRVVADLPLQLSVPTPAQQLHLEVRMDRRQWCLLAMDARGATPAGPLQARMNARAPGTYSEGPGSAGAAGMWAARWNPNSFPSNAPISASFWVGGPDYVTAVAQQTVAADP